MYLSSDCKNIAESMRDQFLRVESTEEKGQEELSDNDEQAKVDKGEPENSSTIANPVVSSGSFQIVSSLDFRLQMNTRNSNSSLSFDQNTFLPVAPQNFTYFEEQTAAETGGNDADTYSHCWLPFNPLVQFYY